jgi:Flp pilus assembly protein protease CpaA
MAGILSALSIAFFLGGVLAGVVALVCLEVRREDRRWAVACEAPDPLSRGTRRLTRMGGRDLDDGLLRPVR